MFAAATVAVEEGDEMAGQTGRSWKIGELAASTGLTVRALHHYDHLGLVRTSRRTAAGHRLYGEADIERLYQVVALRQLGLPLDVIAGVLEGALSVEQVLASHRDFLDRQLVSIRMLRAQLVTTLAICGGAAGQDATDFLDLITKVTTVDDTIMQYFTDEQLAELAERRAELGEDAINDVQVQWSQLIPRVQAAVDAGMDPASAPVQELAAQWMGLLQAFHGGDQGLRNSLYQMQADNAKQIQQQHGVPSPQLMAFIKQANATSS